MNKLINKAIAICKVFFYVSNKIDKLPEISKKYAGKYVLKIHPKGFVMQLRLYNSKGRPEFDIDLHDHDEEEKTILMEAFISMNTNGNLINIKNNIYI